MHRPILSCKFKLRIRVNTKIELSVDIGLKRSLNNESERLLCDEVENEELERLFRSGMQKKKLNVFLDNSNLIWT